MYALKQKVKKPLERYGGNTEDPERKFDVWYTVDIFTPENLLKNLETLDYFPEAIMTSDCRWLERGWDKNHEKDEKISLEWGRLVRKTLDENNGTSVVLLINCDS